MDKRLQVGIDFSHKKADVCLMFPQGELLEPHLSFPNSLTGFGQLKSVLLDARDAYVFDGIDISGEATGYYWMPLFLRLADDPDLTEAALDLFLLNPRWLKWFKKSFPPDDKTDQKDPFYIAERTRTRRPAFTWQPQLETLSLRFYTRYRFHLAQDLTREKNYFTALLFLKLSAYRQFKPFSNTFGVTSSLILSGQLDLDELAQLPLDILAERLTQLSGNRLPEVDKNALKLHDALQHSFPLPPALLPPIQDVLNLTMQHIRFIQQQMTTTETHITAELEKHPAIQKLATIPGVGLIFASGIGAELGDTKRFLQGTKWDKRKKRNRPRTLRNAEDSVAKLAGLWWPKNASGDFEAEERKMAKTGNKYLRYYLIQASDQMRKRIPEYTRYYDRKYLEVNKHQHKRALVLTARKGVGLFVGLLHRNEAYLPEEERCPK